MLWGDWNVCTFETLRLPLAKGSSTFLTKPLFPQGREDVTALRCSEPLRYKVGGASKPSPCCAGWDRMGMSGASKVSPDCAGWDRLGIAGYSLQLIVYSLQIFVVIC